MAKWMYIAILAGALASARPCAADSWVAAPLHLAVRGACLIAMVRVDKVGSGRPDSIRYNPQREDDHGMYADTTDTLSGTVTRVLRWDCAPWAPKPGFRMAFLVSHQHDYFGSAPEGVPKAGDSVIVSMPWPAWELDRPTRKPLERANREPAIQAVLKHETEWDGKPLDLAADLGRFDGDISGSALHELQRMGPRGAPARKALLDLVPSAAAKGRLLDVAFALEAGGMPPDDLRKVLETALDKNGISANKDVLRFLTRFGADAFPRIAAYAASDPDKWVRHAALFLLCDDGIRGPDAKALAERRAKEEPEYDVKHVALKMLAECYGAPAAPSR